MRHIGFYVFDAGVGYDVGYSKWSKPVKICNVFPDLAFIDTFWINKLLMAGYM